jgi:hypothetical protein
MEERYVYLILDIDKLYILTNISILFALLAQIKIGMVCQSKPFRFVYDCELNE